MTAKRRADRDGLAAGLGDLAHHAADARRDVGDALVRYVDLADGVEGHRDRPRAHRLAAETGRLDRLGIEDRLVALDASFLLRVALLLLAAFVAVPVVLRGHLRRRPPVELQPAREPQGDRRNEHDDERHRSPVTSGPS